MAEKMTAEDWEKYSWYRHFEKICAIPHGSGNTRGISNYLKAYASEHGWKVTQDRLGNIIIRKKASEGRSREPGVILQGHMDMVAVKQDDCPLDLKKDGLILQNDGEFLRAKGTSLGGDDGIAIAFALAILDDDSLSHPNLEVLFTIDEETGMDGASGLASGALKGRYLINVDSEWENDIIAGCAGGCRLDGEKEADMFLRRGRLATLDVSGMTGGHSGVQINLGRGNAARVLATVLERIAEECGGQLIDLTAGTQDNVIPSSARATILLKEERIDDALALTKQLAGKLRENYTADPDLRISFSPKNEPEEEYMAFTKQDTLHVCELLMNLPNDVIGMSSDMEGLVETSANIGVVRISDHSIRISSSLRSSVESEKEKLLSRMRKMYDVYGYKTSVRGMYPGWQYDPHSLLCRKAAEVYPRIFGRKANITAIHAGLECGIIMDRVGKLDCISIGPNIYDVHSYNEKLDLYSCEREYRYLTALLAEQF